jgi:16S rRNA C967 or C1407 C5-methylase (RsmB/RsmF family)
LLPIEFLESLPLSESEKELFVQSLQSPVPVSIRLNPKKIAEPLSGIAVPWCRQGFFLTQRPVFTLDPLFHSGAYYVQEASSMFLEQVILQLNLSKTPLNVLDACAAPGGKTTHLLSLLHPESLVVANEVIASRAPILVENAIRWGYSNLVITRGDAGLFKRLESIFDVIVCDAPCSGEGLFRKDAGAISEWSLQNVEYCSLRQQRIVNDLWNALKPGGYFIYSTCTSNLTENETNVQQFIKKHHAECIKLNIKDFSGVEEFHRQDAVMYRFFPHKTGTEIFSLAVLRKPDADNTNSERILHKNLKLADKVQTNLVKEHIVRGEDMFCFIHDNHIRFMSMSLKNTLGQLLNIPVIHAGTAAFEIKGKNLLPSFEFALSTEINQEKFCRAEVDKNTMLKLLKGETRLLDSLPLGQHLITYKSLPMMFLKKIAGRVNVNYPRAWFIRMNIE